MHEGIQVLLKAMKMIPTAVIVLFAAVLGVAASIDSAPHALGLDIQQQQAARYLQHDESDASSGTTKSKVITGLSDVSPGPVQRGRIAVLMPCYNMPEAAMHIIQKLPKRMGNDTELWIDVFVVDNGSKKNPLPSTIPVADPRVRVYVINMPINVQTTHGFHLAMAAARGLTFTQKFQYEAYWLWITSLAIPHVSRISPEDIVSPLLHSLRADPKLGAVVPALWPTPNPFWKGFNAMIFDQATAATPSQLKPALLMDILGMMVRGPLFASVTREGFQPTLLRAWSVDIDLCATVRLAGYKLAVHHGVTLEKRQWVGYSMNRMSEDIKTRIKRSSAEAEDFRIAKYGSKYGKTLLFEEAARIGKPKEPLQSLKKQRV